MKRDINTLKNWFKTGLKPTQSQFWDWLDSFWHKDDNVPAIKINGLQELLDTKVDKRELVQPGQVGLYDAGKNYIYDAQNPEYVSYINSSSPNPQFQVEGFYRLAASAAAGENPETHPLFWVYQGTTLGNIAIDDIGGLREELGVLDDKIKQASNERSYTLDFGLHGEVVQEINMQGEVIITKTKFSNVDQLFLTNSENVRLEVFEGVNEITINAEEVNAWEVIRIEDSELASVGILITKI